jgi:hypothetical protein
MRDYDSVLNNLIADAHRSQHLKRDVSHAPTEAVVRGSVEVEERGVGTGNAEISPERLGMASTGGFSLVSSDMMESPFSGTRHPQNGIGRSRLS